MENRENSNRAVEGFFNNNTQNLNEDNVLLNLSNFYLDEIGDSIVNQAYDQYEVNQFGDDDEDVLVNQAYDQYQANTSNAAVQHVRRINNEHDYIRQNSSDQLKCNLKFKRFNEYIKLYRFRTCFILPVVGMIECRQQLQRVRDVKPIMIMDTFRQFKCSVNR